MASAISSNFRRRLREDLCRLARFGANISDAHSCFIFLPSSLLSPTEDGGADTLVLGGLHSLSDDLVTEPLLAPGSGLIGWVAKHRRSIHVSPFERDSRTLGIYTSNLHLKSFIGIPVEIPCREDRIATGVIACDSKKSFAFSKLQGKLLEDLSREVSSTTGLVLSLASPHRPSQKSWSGFLKTGQEVVESLSRNAVEVLRILLHDYSDFEAAVGPGEAVARTTRMYRLIEQLLPTHVPHYRFPDGSIVCVLDSMMGGYYENRIRAICEHAFQGGAAVRESASKGTANRTRGSRQPGLKGPNLEFRRVSFRDRGYRNLSLEQLISASVRNNTTTEDSTEITRYEYRRA